MKALLPILTATTLLAGLAGCRTASHSPGGTNGPTAADVLAGTTAADWRRPDPAHTLVLDLGPDRGSAVIELAPRLAPHHVTNVLALVREGYFDGLAIVRVQDNYVVQWGDPNAEVPANARPIRTARRHLPAELEFRPSAGTVFTPVPDGDLYAPEAGFIDGFPIARDPATGLCWPIHNYGMVGAGRDNAMDSGGGTELYVVIGHAPRHLDRNVTLLGRVIRGMDVLASLPRGKGAMGFYGKPAEHIPIRSLRVVADIPEAERPRIEILRTDTDTFRRWIEARRNRREPWFHRPAGRIEIGNLPIPSR